MSYYQMELFGHVVYSPELSYEELHSREEALKALVQGILEQVGGVFIQYEAMGDALRFQCVLSEENEATFHQICEELSPAITDGLYARLLVVDKDLGSVYFYSLVDGKWQEAVMELPPAGYLAAPSPVKLGRI